MLNKILFITGPLNGGGAERVLLDILHHIDYDRYNVTLAQIVPGGSLDYEIPSSVKRISLWSSYDLHYKLSLRLSSMFGMHHFLRQRINAKLSHMCFDAVISFLEGMPLKLHGLLNIPSARHISWVHCDLETLRYQSNVFYKNEETLAYLKMDRVVNVSEGCSLGFSRLFSIDSSKLSVIHNPIDLKKIAKLISSPILINKVFTIVSVGRLTNVKRFDRLIKLAQKLRNESVSFKIIVIGEGENKKELLDLTENNHLVGFVEFKGFVTNPYEEIKKANVLLCTSESESFCLALVEAMALSIPVISTRTKGSECIIGDNQYGLLVEQSDRSIFEGVMKLYNEENLGHYYQQMGRKRAKDFDMPQFMDKFYNLLQ